jgi:hypothetical protein
MGCQKPWLAVALGLSCCLGVMGCLHLGDASTLFTALAEVPTPGRSSGEPRRKDAIPLVPLPPLPFYRGRGRPAPTTRLAANHKEETEGTLPKPVPDPPVSSSPAPPQTPVLGPVELYQEAAKRYAEFDSYIARLRRREFFKGKMKPEEVLLFMFRKQPWSVHCKWLGKVARGREVVYVRGEHDNKIHTLLAAGDHPFLGAGHRLSLEVGSVFVRAACRHPITEAGIGASIHRLGVLIEAGERGDRSGGVLKALGPMKRPEFRRPGHALEHVIPPGVESTLPRGGRRLYWFQASTGLPVLIQTFDDQDREVEYYCYDRLLYPVHLDEKDFDPDQLWGKENTP